MIERSPLPHGQALPPWQISSRCEAKPPIFVACRRHRACAVTSGGSARRARSRKSNPRLTKTARQTGRFFVRRPAARQFWPWISWRAVLNQRPHGQIVHENAGDQDRRFQAEETAENRLRIHGALLLAGPASGLIVQSLQAGCQSDNCGCCLLDQTVATACFLLRRATRIPGRRPSAEGPEDASNRPASDVRRDRKPLPIPTEPIPPGLLRNPLQGRVNDRPPGAFIKIDGDPQIAVAVVVHGRLMPRERQGKRRSAAQHVK